MELEITAIDEEFEDIVVVHTDEFCTCTESATANNGSGQC